MPLRDLLWPPAGRRKLIPLGGGQNLWRILRLEVNVDVSSIQYSKGYLCMTLSAKKRLSLCLNVALFGIYWDDCCQHGDACTDYHDVAVRASCAFFGKVQITQERFLLGNSHL